jgi:hypothetical protein
LLGGAGRSASTPTVAGADTNGEACLPIQWSPENQETPSSTVPGHNPQFCDGDHVYIRKVVMTITYILPDK